MTQVKSKVAMFVSCPSTGSRHNPGIAMRALGAPPVKKKPGYTFCTPAIPIRTADGCRLGGLQCLPNRPSSLVGGAASYTSLLVVLLVVVFRRIEWTSRRDLGSNRTLELA
jgi:hypothetical protein